MESTFLSNKPLPEKISEKADEIIAQGEKKLFAVVCDLALKGKYGESALIMTDSRLLLFDDSYENGVLDFEISSIEEAQVKRMYGNAVLKITKDGHRETVLRFTYSVAVLCDAAVLFLNNINKENSTIEKEMEIVKAGFEKAASTCPKCGRQLKDSKTECVHCASKGKMIKKFAPYVKPQLVTLIGCILLSFVITALDLVPPYITKMIVDEIVPNKDASKLLYVVMFLLVVYIFTYALGTIRGYFLRIAGSKIVESLRNDIYRRAQYLPMSFFDKTSTGSVIARISNDTSTLQAFILRIMQEAVNQVFLLIGIVVVMLALNWKLTLISLIPIPIIAIGSRTFGKKISPFYHRIWRRWSAVSSLLTDTLPGVKVIKSFTSEKRAINKFEKYNKRWFNEDKRAAFITNFFPHAVTFAVVCGSLFIWAIGGKWAITGEGTFTVGLLVSFISYANKFYVPVNFFANLNDSYQNALTSAERVLDIIDAEPESDFGKGNTVSALKGKIEFRNVNFSFDKTKKTLSNINLVINPGDIVGIVGTTGSGKSTLINLLMRFYDGYEGEILVDDVNIKDIDLESYREKIGYVQQEPMMFKDTIFSNIAYSNPNAHVEQVIHAADVANAHGFIAKLPDAYDTMLGERGVGLSGGERQRVSIARAVLKNPSLLIFDEATAAVDSETEHLIQEAIERLIKGRTTLMIAHRLSTLRKANKIIVVDKGEIIENGTPEELMALKGKYYKLIQIQSMSDKAREIKEAENFE